MRVSVILCDGTCGRGGTAHGVVNFGTKWR